MTKSPVTQRLVECWSITLMGSVDESASSQQRKISGKNLNPRMFFTFFPLFYCAFNLAGFLYLVQVLRVFSLEKRWLRETLLLSLPERRVWPVWVWSFLPHIK